MGYIVKAEGTLSLDDLEDITLEDLDSFIQENKSEIILLMFRKGDWHLTLESNVDESNNVSSDT